MRCFIAAAAIALLLSACGTNRDELSFQACAASAREATERSRAFSDDQKRSFEIDEASSRTSIKQVDESVFELRVIASIRNEQGQSTRQDFLCRTRFAEGTDSPDVIAFTFLLEGQ
jgi:ribosomal protein L23